MAEVVPETPDVQEIGENAGLISILAWSSFFRAGFTA